MSRVLFCGDIHNKAKRILPEVDKAIERQGINHIVFLGDYVDEFNEGTKRIVDSTLFLADWVKTRRSEGLTVNALLGNHDLPYVVVYQDSGYYQVRNSVSVPNHGSAQYKLRDTMRSMIDSVAVYISYKDVKDLVNKTNRLYKQDSLYRLSWAGPERGGFDLPSPCWAGEHELIEGALHGVTQVVGHTPHSGIIKRVSDGGGDLWFCDTHSWVFEEQRGDGSMLMLDTEEGKFEIVKSESWNRFE